MIKKNIGKSMVVRTSISSQLTSQILILRNPEGREAGWSSDNVPLEWVDRHRSGAVQFIQGEYTRKTITEIALSFVAVIALIETVVYGVLATLALGLSPYTDRPYRFFAALLDSSSFTILWTIHAIFINFRARQLETRECFYRHEMDEEGGVGERWCHSEYRREWLAFRAARNQAENDMAFARGVHLEEALAVDGIILEEGHPLHPLAPRTPQEAEEQLVAAENVSLEEARVGATAVDLNDPIYQKGKALVNALLEDLNQQDYDLWQETDTGIYQFLVTKAICRYVFGDNKADQDLSLFTEHARGLVEVLRRDFVNVKESDLVKMREALTSLEIFSRNANLDGTWARMYWTTLKGRGFEESQGSNFTHYFNVAFQSRTTATDMERIQKVKSSGLLPTVQAQLARIERRLEKDGGLLSQIECKLLKGLENRSLA